MAENDKSLKDDIKIINFFIQQSKNKKKLWAWQQLSSKDARAVHFITVRKVEAIKKFVEIESSNTEGFKFVKDADIFIFSGEDGYAAKVPIRTMEKHQLTFPIPSKLTILSKEFLEKLEIIEKENEQKHSHLRTAPRKQAKKDQIVGIKKVSANGNIENYFKLHDISKGGLGFIVFDPADFQQGDELEVFSVDGKPIKSIVGKVMSVRQLEDEVVDAFKVGVKFNS